MYVWDFLKKQLCDVVRNLSREFEIFIFVIILLHRIMLEFFVFMLCLLEFFVDRYLSQVGVWV
jgi:hypothetical protein